MQPVVCGAGIKVLFKYRYEKICAVTHPVCYYFWHTPLPVTRIKAQNQFSPTAKYQPKTARYSTTNTQRQNQALVQVEK